MKSKLLALTTLILLIIGNPSFSLSQSRRQSDQEAQIRAQQEQQRRAQQEAYRRQQEEQRRAQEAQVRAQQQRAQQEAYRRQQEEQRRAQPTPPPRTSNPVLTQPRTPPAPTQKPPVATTRTTPTPPPPSPTVVQPRTPPAPTPAPSATTTRPTVTSRPPSPAAAQPRPQPAQPSKKIPTTQPAPEFAKPVRPTPRSSPTPSPQIAKSSPAQAQPPGIAQPRPLQPQVENPLAKPRTPPSKIDDLVARRKTSQPAPRFEDSAKTLEYRTRVQQPEQKSSPDKTRPGGGIATLPRPLPSQQPQIAQPLTSAKTQTTPSQKSPLDELKAQPAKPLQNQLAEKTGGMKGTKKSLALVERQALADKAAAKTVEFVPRTANQITSLAGRTASGTTPSQMQQSRDPTRQKKMEQLRKEAEEAEKEYQRREADVKRLERFEKPAKIIQGAADAGVGVVSSKVGPIGTGIEQIYKGVTKSILDPQGAERREKIIDQWKSKREEERLKKEKWTEDIRKRQEEFNKRLQGRLDLISVPAPNATQTRATTTTSGSSLSRISSPAGAQPGTKPAASRGPTPGSLTIPSQGLPTNTAGTTPATIGIDNPSPPKEGGLSSEVKRIAPVVGTLGNLAQDTKSKQLDKVPEDIRQLRGATTQYLANKMRDPNSPLYRGTDWMDKPGVQRALQPMERTLTEVEKAAPVAGSLGSIARSMKSKQVDKVPGDIKQARAATTEYLTEKMGNDPGKSRLYKATDWMDRPGMKRVLQANEKALGEVEKAAPAVTSLGSLARSLRDPNKWDKVQKATAEARKQTTDYFASQMGDDPSKSRLYQHTNWMDKPGAQKQLQRIEKGLDILEKDKLIGGGLSATAHIRRMELSKLQEDFGNLRRGASEDLKAVGDKGGDFLVKRMGPDPMESRLYKSTEWMDNPTLRKGTQLAERGLDRIEKSQMLKTGLEYTEKGINLVKKAKDVKETVITARKKLQDIEKRVGGALEKGKEKIRGWWERVTD